MPYMNGEGSGDDHIAKRPKLTASNSRNPSGAAHQSRIFAPFRTIGLVSTTDVPFTSVPLGKTTFQITTSVGRCLQTYDLRRGLNLVFLTRPETPSNITATYAWKDRVFAAWGGRIAGSKAGVWVFQRGKKTAELEEVNGLDEPVRQMIIFGSWIVGCCSTRIEVWKSSTYEHYTTLMSASPSCGKSSDLLSGVICNLPTFLNKILVGKQDGSLDIWNISTGQVKHTIAPPNYEAGSVTALQPSPALSLVAIAREDGSIVIQNIRADKEVIRLNSKTSRRSSTTSISFRTDGLGAGEDGHKAGVMATSSSENGDVTLWDLNHGGRVMGVLRDAHNSSSSAFGGVSSGVSKVEFLPGQPILITTGLDNALKSWIFDETPSSPTPRLLHIRSGHAAPVTRLKYLPSEADGADASGKWLLSASRDQSLWGWSLRRDGQSTELSQGNIQKRARKLGASSKGLDLEKTTTLEDLKAPEITCMACSLNRDGGMGASTGGGAVWTNSTNRRSGIDATGSGSTGWESVVTGHKGDKCARTWFWGRKKAGRWAFETGDKTEVKSVAVTNCGAFALVGSGGGGIDMFNLQSGLHRQSFPSPLTPAQARKSIVQKKAIGNGDLAIDAGIRSFGLGKGRHTKAVTGLDIDGLNRTVISCGLDGKIKFWDFASSLLQHEIDWYPMTAITASRYHRQSDLMAFSCDDLSIRVVDIVTKKLVRELWGNVGQIHDFCFSNDGRWIIAASMDSIIRVWDLPTGHLIDAMRLESACTSLTFSYTGEFLATAHADSVGISIWTNRTLFTHVPTRHIQESEVVQAAVPRASGEGGQGLIDAAFDEEVEEGGASESLATLTEQLSKDMTTLSLVPRNQWQTLLHLDLIRQRNKPIEPPKAPEKAPFFLPSLYSAKPSSSENKKESEVSTAERSRVSKMERNRLESDFTNLLHSGAATGNYDDFIGNLKSLSPSTTDIEIRSLNPLAESDELSCFVAALTARLRLKLDYELVQAWMAVFLRIHGETVGSNRNLMKEVRAWKLEQEKESKRLGDLVGYCSGVVGFLRSGRV